MPLYKGDIGNTLQATLVIRSGSTTTPVDLTGATVYFLLEKPSGTVVQKTATVSSPKKGIATYTTIANDIGETGVWNWQAKVVYGDGTTWHGDIDSFEVHDVLVASS